MNPILREGLGIYYGERHGLQIYFYLLIILAPVEFFSLYLPSLDAQVWSGSGNLFKICATAALALIVYFTLRVANQEYVPWRFKPLRHWLRENHCPAWMVAHGQLAFIASHVMLSLLLCLPLLAWAAAISRTPLSRLALVFALLPSYAICYGVWGLVALACLERRPESRQVIIRCFYFVIVVVSLLIYLPLNPAAFLLSVIGQQPLRPLTVGGVALPADAVHFTFHGLLFAGGLTLHRWLLERGASD